MKRFLLLTLAFSMLLASCGESEGIADETSGNGADTTEEAYPLNVVDFGKTEFGILCRTEEKDEIWADDEEGEILNDAIYERNRAVEERYNITIAAYDVAGSWSERENFYKAFTGSVLAGEDIYDLVAYYEACAQVPVSEGYMMNLLDIGTIDFSHEWWYPGYNDALTVNGKLYSCLGDIAQTTFKYPAVTLFNKTLLDKYGMDYPYQAVKDGKWTFDMLCEMAAEVSDDLDGNGVYDENDLYGWLTSEEMLRCMSTSFEFPLSVVDAGKPKLTVGSEKYIEVYDRVFDIIWNDNWATIFKDNSTDAARTKCFTDGHALFFNYDLSRIAELRGMKDDFGIIPYPKYNEDQEDYHTVVFDAHSVFCIPTTAKDPERSGLILEAMGYESMKRVIPAYYEVVLGGKVARDDASVEMLDMIRDSFDFDFAMANAQIVNGVFAFFGYRIFEGVESISSVLASRIPTWNEQFDSLLEFYGVE